MNPIPDTVFDGSVRYLGVQVGADPEITLRKPMVSVPYAYRAGGGGGGWIDDGIVVRLVDSTDYVGIGATTPNEQLELTGNFRLPPSTASVGVIKSGANRFIHNFGADNFFAGVNAGNLTLSGTGGNTGVGVNTLHSNSTGYYNTAMGHGALYSNTTGNSNTAMGLNALAYNSTGYFNTAMGIHALFSNTTGNYNTAMGFNALAHNTTGNYNTAVGHYAFFYNTTGDNNTAVGRDALLSNTTGTNNTAIGFGADVSMGGLINATAIGGLRHCIC